MTPSLRSVPEPGHSEDPARGELGERLLELAERYARITELPDDVAALRRLYGELAANQAKLLVLLDRMGERIDRLERRQRGAP